MKLCAMPDNWECSSQVCDRIKADSRLIAFVAMYSSYRIYEYERCRGGNCKIVILQPDSRSIVVGGMGKPKQGDVFMALFPGSKYASMLDGCDI